uniref:Cytochrome b n=1 Tax=Rhinebothrium sp. 1 TaxID=108307 RepID=A0A8K1W6A9_9CEST|nr:cytochrome b [Rhinebothrium sp. 1]UFQ88682.1 cytochrome b [Rhinebothrium sp. 1]UFQ88694.1 cytochrome b [Rhinebothrium sp. 1]
MISLIRSNLIDLPTNYSLSYYWCSGFMISAFMVFQVFTGVILSLLYVADVHLSFQCVMDLTNDSFFTWCVRYWHIWGVTVLFVLFFIHMGRALYYSSYSKKGVWNVGFVLYLLTMAEAFMGYILPWHQMSYWAATVLTSIVQSVPVVGPTLYKYVVGGFSVTNVTLVRVFSAHVCLGFVILGLMVLHLFYLHKSGSNNPLFMSAGYGDVVYFHSYFTAKDFFCLVVLTFITVFFLFWSPDFVVDTEGYLEADPLTTPVNIKPEWYFLIYYAMLRSIDSKIGGLVLVLSLLFFLWVPSFNYSCPYFFMRQLTFWLICSLFLGLTYLGACHPEYPYLTVCKIFSIGIVAFMFIFKLLWWGGSNSNHLVQEVI